MEEKQHFSDFEHGVFLGASFTEVTRRLVGVFRNGLIYWDLNHITTISRFCRGCFFLCVAGESPLSQGLQDTIPECTTQPTLEQSTYTVKEYYIYIFFRPHAFVIDCIMNHSSVSKCNSCSYVMSHKLNALRHTLSTSAIIWFLLHFCVSDADTPFKTPIKFFFSCKCFMVTFETVVHIHSAAQTKF